MSSVNKVILVGRVGKDPELRNGQANPVAIFSMATTEVWYDKNSKEKNEKTEWHNIVVWGKQGEIVHKYVNKGSLIYVEGKLTTEKYTDKNGIEKWSTKIVARDVKFLSPKGEQSQTHVAPMPQKVADPEPPPPPPYSSLDDIPF